MSEISCPYLCNPIDIEAELVRNSTKIPLKCSFTKQDIGQEDMNGCSVIVPNKVRYHGKIYPTFLNDVFTFIFSWLQVALKLKKSNNNNNVLLNVKSLDLCIQT